MLFRWNGWNEEHIAAHGVEPEEAEGVVLGARPPFPLGQADEKYLVWGSTASGRLSMSFSSLPPAIRSS